MTIETNNAGFVNFSNKNWSFNGDKGTWAKVSEKDGVETLTIKRSGKGALSSDFEAEMQAFGEKYGVDFNAVGCGCTVSVEVKEEEETEKQDDKIFGRQTEEGVEVLYAKDGEPVTSLDENVYPIGSEVSARYEHAEGIILYMEDAEKLGIEIEDADVKTQQNINAKILEFVDGCRANGVDPQAILIGYTNMGESEIDTEGDIWVGNSWWSDADKVEFLEWCEGH